MSVSPACSTVGPQGDGRQRPRHQRAGTRARRSAGRTTPVRRSPSRRPRWRSGRSSDSERLAWSAAGVERTDQPAGLERWTSPSTGDPPPAGSPVARERGMVHRTSCTWSRLRPARSTRRFKGRLGTSASIRRRRSARRWKRRRPSLAGAGRPRSVPVPAPGDGRLLCGVTASGSAGPGEGARCGRGWRTSRARTASRSTSAPAGASGCRDGVDPRRRPRDGDGGRVATVVPRRGTCS
jgi:hypothetical protein